MALANHPSAPHCGRCGQKANFRVAQLRKLSWGTKSATSDMCRSCAVNTLGRVAVDVTTSVLISHLYAVEDPDD